ncbi:hypothetical protein ABPG74_001982 [Tetrahymena malaccensis]
MQNVKIIISRYCENTLQQLESFVNNQLILEFESDCADDLQFILQIGDQLGKLTNVVDLSIIFDSYTRLKQEAWKYIFQGLELLKQLQKLEIFFRQSCSLEDQGLNLLGQAFSSLSSLKKLTINIYSFNYVSVQSLKNLISNFKYLSQIEELKLIIPNYDIEICEEKLDLWSGLSYLQSIQDLELYLNLQYNTQVDIDDFLQTLISFKKLTKLNLALDYNQQEFSFVKKLTFYLEQLTQLKELNLNLFQKVQQKEDILLISTFFRKLINLEKLQLQSCFSYFQQPIDEYYESLAFLPFLTDLQIEIPIESSTESDRKRIQCLNNKQRLNSIKIVSSKENLKDQIFDSITQSLKQNNQIQSLVLHFNRLDKQSQSLALCESLKSMNHLKQLNFSTNLDKSKIKCLNQVLESVGKIKSLQKLDLNLDRQLFGKLQRKKELALSHLKLLNLAVFKINIKEMLFSNEFLELGQILQNQQDLQELSIIISFQRSMQNSSLFGWLANQQQQPNKGNQIESIEDFLQGIKSLQNLKNLYYGISHSNENKQILDQILSSFKNLKNLEDFNITNNRFQEDSQGILLSEAISNMKNLKNLSFYNSDVQQTLQKQISQFQTLQNLEKLFLCLNCQNLDNPIVGFEQLFSKLHQLRIANLNIQIYPDSEFVFQDLFKGIQSLKKIEDLEINLGNYKFRNKDADQFSQTCQGLQNLRKFDFQNFKIHKHFTQEGTGSLRDAFFKLKKLKFLSILFKIPRVEFSKMIQGAFQNSNLNSLSLQFETETEQDSDGVFQIEQQQKEKLIVESKERNKSNLTDLYVTFKQGKQYQVEDLTKFYEQFEDFQNLNKLQVFHDWELDQNQNKLIECTKMLASFYSSFKQFKKMKELKIEFKNSSYNFEEIPIQNMKHLINLRKLELVLLKNNIISDHLLFDQIKYFTHLQSLRIEISQETPFSKNAAISLGNSLIKLKQLLTLDLIFSENCSIEQEGAVQIGTGIGYLSYLCSLNIYLGEQCQINQEGAIKIAEGISKIFTLNKLNLNISGQNKVGKQGGVALASSIKSSKYLTEIFFQIQNESSNHQGQQFLNEISNSLSELKMLKSLLLAVSFDENLEFCPEQLKQFICSTCTSKVILNIENLYGLLTTRLKSEDSQNKVELIFQYDQSLSNIFPKAKIECLQNISKEVKLDIMFNLSQSITQNNYITSIKKQIEQLQVSNLKLNLEYYQFQDSFLDCLILPVLQNQKLIHFDLALSQKGNSNISSEVFTKIGQNLSKLNLMTLKLLLKDSSYQLCQNYQLILDQLKFSKTLVDLSLYKYLFDFSNQYKYFKNTNRLVNFNSNYKE